MSSRRSLLVVLSLGVLVALSSAVRGIDKPASVAAAPHAVPATRPGGARVLRVGVYDSRAVCVGSRKSAAFGEQLEALRTQLDAAQAAGDTKRVEQIKRRGQTLQTVKHLQAFSNAPVDEILDQIRDRLPDVARQTGVDLIVARADFSSADVEVVDVTDALVKAFEPDEATIKTVADLRKHPPMAMADVLEHQD